VTRQSWSRTSNLLFVRKALSQLSYPPVRLRDKESNLDLHVQSVASSRLDDPGMSFISCSVVQATRPPFDPGSAKSPSYVEELWSPALLCRPKNFMLKPKHYLSLVFRAESTEEPFSLGRSLILDQRLFKLSIFLSFDVTLSPETTRATRWVALA
jgi:hypothetical protein